MKDFNQKGNISLIILVIAILTIGGVVYLKATSVQPIEVPLLTSPSPQSSQNNQLKTHTSQNLKISFKYPKEWYVDDRYQMILLTNYMTNLNRDDKPSEKQLEVLFKFFSGCHQTIEENLMDPACGEGGKSVKKNQILSKETKQLSNGVSHKYIVLTPSNKKLTFYLIESKNIVLQISKQPDPSQFEKEFEDIINSIEFI